MNVADPVAPATTPPPRSPAQAPVHKVDPYADDEDGAFEVVQGVRVEKPMGVLEQYIAGILHGRLSEFCRANPVGYPLVETMFAIPGSGNDRKPDVAFVSFQTWPASRPIPRATAWAIAPDLAVEVVSPTDKLFDVFDKVREYFASGVGQVWLICSNVEQVYIFTSPTAVRILARGDELAGDPVIPGFRMPVADLFPPSSPTP